MLSEFLLSLVTLSFSFQSSSLWKSLLLIPGSIILMIGFNINELASGFLAFIFIMVFIGGLMVLLVSVASTSPQEQSVSASLFMCFMFVSASMIFFKEDHSYSWGESVISLSAWGDFPKLSIANMSFLAILIGLSSITMLVSEFKGLTRML